MSHISLCWNELMRLRLFKRKLLHEHLSHSFVQCQYNSTYQVIIVTLCNASLLSVNRYQWCFVNKTIKFNKFVLSVSLRACLWGNFFSARHVIMIMSTWERLISWMINNKKYKKESNVGGYFELRHSACYQRLYSNLSSIIENIPLIVY